MDEQEFLLDSEKLVDSIRRYEWFTEQVPKKDVDEPTAKFVQTVFYKFLMGLGYSETLLNTNQSELCILEELGEHAGKY